jgi:hypothetical protein
MTRILIIEWKLVFRQRALCGQVVGEGEGLSNALGKGNRKPTRLATKQGKGRKG